MVRGVEKSDGNLEDSAQVLLGGSGWVRPGSWLTPREAPSPDFERLEKVGLVFLSRSIYFYPNFILDQTKT